MARQQNQGLLFEMLRSFTTLARTLNLSKAVKQLGTTRQTVRRHITLLEEEKGAPLFTLEDRQYRLTDVGARALREAEDILARGEAWLKNQSGHLDNLFHVTYAEDNGFCYYLQQHPISKLWQESSPLLQRTLQCWAEAKGALEDPAMDPVRPYFMVFRRHENEWVCVEVGNKSSYATWYGWRWQRSSVGRGVGKLPGGPSFASMLAKPFEDVKATAGMRLDHIHTQISRGDDDQLTPISYQRLLLGSRFPDGSFAMIAVIDRTYNLQVAGLDQALLHAMSPELVMNITDDMLKSETSAQA